MVGASRIALLLWLTVQSHVNPLKYTCPRCGIHTCSLPCVKRHKQWAQCSGVRDPAEYRKRSELATPSSIDKDFNFITKVERTLQRADDTVEDKGLDLAPARLPHHDNKSKVELEVASRGIQIVRAPKALSRSKQNKTHWAGNANCVMWTIEWICQDGEKRTTNIHETKSIEEAYIGVFGKSYGKKSHGVKRKRAREDIEKQEHAEDTQVQTSHAENPEAEHESKTSDSVPMSTEENIVSPTQSIRYYYLHRPNTEAKYKCLVPIPSDAILKETFSNRTFVEFPTIYIRGESPDQLREPFISEERYVEKYGTDIPINIAVPSASIPTGADVDEEEEGEIPVPSDTASTLNEAKVLEVLAKDLGG